MHFWARGRAQNRLKLPPSVIPRMNHDELHTFPLLSWNWDCTVHQLSEALVLLSRWEPFPFTRHLVVEENLLGILCRIIQYKPLVQNPES
jgi:hypothetical protein